MVNGPEGSPRLDLDAVDWDWVDWYSAEREVGRLRQRIFKASQEGDLAKVRSLQKLMLRSRSNTLLSVRQVTQRNAGRKTAGIDGEVALTSEARADVAVRVHQSISSWRPRANAMGFRYLGINARFPVLVTVGSSWSRACRRSACHAGWRPVPRAGELASWGGSAVFALVRRACSRG